MPTDDQPARATEPLAAEFEALYDAHVGLVWRALRCFGVPQQNLEDATQDVFVVVHRRFGAWGEPGSLRPWLWGVARRVASARRRTLERHQRKLDALPPPADVRPIDGRADARHQLEQIAAAIDALAPPRREVWILVELEGMRPPEIARMLDCKLDTVYSRLRRARADLRAALTRAGLDDVTTAPARPAQPAQPARPAQPAPSRVAASQRSHARAR